MHLFGFVHAGTSINSSNRSGTLFPPYGDKICQTIRDFSPKAWTKVEDRHTLGAQKNTCTNEERMCMGKAIRTTKLLIDLGERTQGAANTRKRAYLEETAKILDAARAFYVAFCLAHPEKLHERVNYVSDKDQQERERLISPNELLTWAEFQTVETKEHPHPRPDWNFSERFPDMPFTYRRSVIKDALGKARSYLSNLANWRASGKKSGQPGPPGASNHPTLYEGAFALELDETDLRQTFARLKVYTGATWECHHYPVKLSRYFQARRTDPAWEQHSPKLLLHGNAAALHFSQAKEVQAKKEKHRNPDHHLVTVADGVHGKNLAG